MAMNSSTRVVTFRTRDSPISIPNASPPNISAIYTNLMLIFEPTDDLMLAQVSPQGRMAEGEGT